MDTIQVHQTKDYGLFKTVEGNRQLNELHKKRLMQSMSKQYLVNPIIVNEHHQIIDGQHRYTAAMEMGLPVYYIQIDGYGLREVQTLNQNNKNWTSSDFLQAYCDLGYESYIRFRDFVDQYDFTISIAHSVALGTGYSKRDTDQFKDGLFKFDDQAGAEDRAIKMHTLKAYTPLYNTMMFLYAMLTLFKRPQFDFSTFVQKLSYQQAVLVKCSSVGQYIALIEQIYNHRNRNKVSLRY